MDHKYKDSAGRVWPALINPDSVVTVDGVKSGIFAVFLPMPRSLRVRIVPKNRHVESTCCKA